MLIYVANLSDEISEEDLNKAFKPFGKVESTSLQNGYAFVELSTPEEGAAAIEGLNGKELKGKSIVVNKANRAQRRGSGSGYHGKTKKLPGAPGSNSGAHGNKQGGFPGGKVSGSRRGD